jgi:hypothetical protein
MDIIQNNPFLCKFQQLISVSAINLLGNFLYKKMVEARAATIKFYRVIVL